LVTIYASFSLLIWRKVMEVSILNYKNEREKVCDSVRSLSHNLLFYPGNEMERGREEREGVCDGESDCDSE
jgi:hypothetical protein